MTYKIKVAGRLTPAARVTEVIRQTLAAPALNQWMLEQVAQYAQHATNGQRMAATPKELVAAWRGSSRGAAERGSRIHAYAAACLTGGVPATPTPSERGYALAFTNWLADHQGYEPVAVEQTVTTGKTIHPVAGTFDALFTDGDDLVLCDWKTCEETPPAQPYLNQVTQVGAYADMRLRLLPDGSTTGIVPRPTRAFVVYLTPRGYVEREVDLEQAETAWLFVLHLWTMRKNLGG